jgi:hypothetical protein
MRRRDWLVVAIALLQRARQDPARARLLHAVAALCIAEACKTRRAPERRGVPLDMTTLSEEQHAAFFRFTRTEIVQLHTALGLSDIHTAQGTFSALEVLYMVCFRLQYPGKLSALEAMFAKSRRSLSSAMKAFMEALIAKWGFLISQVEKDFVDIARLELYEYIDLHVCIP